MVLRMANIWTDGKYLVRWRLLLVWIKLETIF